MPLSDEEKARNLAKVTLAVRLAGVFFLFSSIAVWFDVGAFASQFLGIAAGADDTPLKVAAIALFGLGIVDYFVIPAVLKKSV